jgi:hypothetical protein
MDINNGNNIRRTESEGTEEELGEFTQPQRETLQPHHRIHVDTVLPTPRRVQDPETNRAFRDYFRKTARNNPTNDMTHLTGIIHRKLTHPNKTNLRLSRTILHHPPVRKIQ